MAVETEREHLDPDLERVARANLKELGDIRIDDVLSFVDRGIEKMPSYMDLYRRWEAQQWRGAGPALSLHRPGSLRTPHPDPQPAHRAPPPLFSPARPRAATHPAPPFAAPPT